MNTDKSQPQIRWVRIGLYVSLICLLLISTAKADEEAEESEASLADEETASSEDFEQIEEIEETEEIEQLATTSTQPEQKNEETIENDEAQPLQFEPTKGRQCHRYLGRWVCEGPRKVPVAGGVALERAKRLGLGTRRTAAVILRGPPPPEWIEELGRAEVEETIFHWPVDNGRLWRGFGNVRHRGRRRLHKGIDVGAPAGTPIRAVLRGLVVYSDNTVQGYGNLILIVHPDSAMTLYAHNSANHVFAGQIVERGQQIGEVGATGLAYGAHLHFELRRNGRPLNPQRLFDDRP